MKRVAIRPKREPRQIQDEAPQDGEQPSNRRGELIEMRFLINETLATRCECYFSANAWLYVKESPELRNIARKAIEWIVSKHYLGLGENDETPNSR